MERVNLISVIIKSLCTNYSKKRLNMHLKPYFSVTDKLSCSPAKDTYITTSKKTYAKISGLRSMQNIKGAEREIIEMYRNELTHEIWGDKQKLKLWAEKKLEELANGNYPSKLLSDKDVKCREDGVKAWYDAIKSSYMLKYDTYNQLKVMKFVTDNLQPDNKASFPPLNLSVLEEAVRAVKIEGVSFKKSYYKKMREFDTRLNVNTENVIIDDISGKWYSIKVPSASDASRNIAYYKHVNDFIAVLSQGTNWCLRIPKNVGKGFSNCDIHIFIDNKGKSQLCLTTVSGGGNRFTFVCGNNQYAPIPEKFKGILRAFIESRNFTNAVVGEESNNIKSISEFY